MIDRAGRRTSGLRLELDPPAGPAEAGVRVAPAVADDRRGSIRVDGRSTAITLERLDRLRGRLVAGRGDPTMVLFPGRVVRLADGRARREVVVDGWRFLVVMEPERRASLRDRAHRPGDVGTGGGPTELRAVIPGKVVRVEAAEGQSVAGGDRLLVLEAMKMQNEIRAPRSGTVTRVAVTAGQSVELGDPLLAIE